MGARTASLLRDSDAEQRVLPGSRGRNAGVLRTVPRRVGIAKSGRATAAVPRIPGARLRRRCRPAIHAEREIDGMGAARGFAEVERTLGPQSARPHPETLQ